MPESIQDWTGQLPSIQIAQSAEPLQSCQTGIQTNKGGFTYISCLSTAPLLSDAFYTLPLLCLVSQGTTFPRLPCPPASSSIWSMRVSRGRLEGRRKGEARVFYPPQSLLPVASLPAEIFQHPLCGNSSRWALPSWFKLPLDGLSSLSPLNNLFLVSSRTLR